MRKYLITAASLVSLTVASNSFAGACPTGAILVRGSSASQSIVQAIAQVAVAQTPPVYIVYSNDGSSGGGVFDVTTDPAAAGRPALASAQMAYDSTGPTVACDLPAGQVADIGVSDVYAPDFANVTITHGTPATTLATLGTIDATLFTDTLGPVQVFTISVHDDPSYPVAISAGAVFNVFGLTGRDYTDHSYDVAPWTVDTNIFGRGADSGTWQTWSRNVGLDPTKPVTVAPQGGAGGVLTMLNATAQNSAIGIIALNDIVPIMGVAPLVRPLAFQAKGQNAAFYPSSTATGTDLLNVRDGHYQTWGHLHFLARKVPFGATGTVPANVQAVLDLLETQATLTKVTKIRAVPNCAMQVDRTTDGGDFTAFKPTKPCGCFFEATAAGTAPATCTTCTDDTTCGASGQCVFGYCEAK